MMILKLAARGKLYPGVIVLILLTVAAGIAQAGSENLRIRVLAGMEPLGRMTLVGVGRGGGDLSLGAAYGFSPGLEALWIFNKRIELGLGFQWGLPRRVFRGGGDAEDSFSFIPIYAAARINLTRLENARLYLGLRIGYALLITSPAFRRIPDKPFTSSSGPGGLFAAAVLGVSLTLKERPKWGLDLSAELGYAYRRAVFESDSRGLPVHFQSMTVNLALGWRF